jgi:N-formylglutamate amidohydrolase
MRPKYRLTGEDGNIFNLMGIVSRTLKEAGEAEKANEMIRRITKGAKSYDEALVILMEYVDVE